MINMEIALNSIATRTRTKKHMLLIDRKAILPANGSTT